MSGNLEHRVDLLERDLAGLRREVAELRVARRHRRLGPGTPTVRARAAYEALRGLGPQRAAEVCRLGGFPQWCWQAVRPLLVAMPGVVVHGSRGAARIEVLP